MIVVSSLFCCLKKVAEMVGMKSSKRRLDLK